MSNLCRKEMKSMQKIKLCDFIYKLCSVGEFHILKYLDTEYIHKDKPVKGIPIIVQIFPTRHVFHLPQHWRRLCCVCVQHWFFLRQLCWSDLWWMDSESVPHLNLLWSTQTCHSYLELWKSDNICNYYIQRVLCRFVHVLIWTSNMWLI